MKITYTSQLYIWFLYVLIGVLLVVNTLSFIRGQTLALLPLVIQLIVLTSILIKSKFVKTIVRIYGLILILAGGFQFLGQLLFLLADAQDKINYNTMLSSLILVALGLVIFIFCNKTIEVSS